MNIQKQVLIAGGSGFIGSAISHHLLQLGYRVVILSRQEKKHEKIIFSKWNPHDEVIDVDVLKQSDILINLSGENIGAKRWTGRRKAILVESRMLTTRFLYDTIKSVDKKFDFYIGASAVGYYGKEYIGREYREDDPEGNTFLSDICGDWEQEHKNIAKYSDEYAILRLGVVLSKKYGAFPEMAKKRFGRFLIIPGSGMQVIPWVHVSDVQRVVEYVLEGKATGKLNVVAGNEKYHALMKHVRSFKKHKPSLLTLPEKMLKFAMGEKSTLLLDGVPVSNDKLKGLGFTFKYPAIEEALRSMLL